MLICYSLLGVETLIISYLTLSALCSFYNIVQTLKPHFTLRKSPILALTSSLLIWTIANILEEVILAKNFTDLLIYDNIRESVLI